MNKHILIALLAIVVGCNSLPDQPTDYTEVKVSMDNAILTNVSSWEGWGTSLCWWANRIGYNETLTQKSADLFFDKDKGLGLNIMRYNVGGGDDPTHNHIIRTDSDVPGWMYIDPETGERKWDYSADQHQLNVLSAGTKAAGEDAYIEIFSNSPPYFMTVSGCSTGNFNPSEDNIKSDEYDDFAEYMAHVADYMTNEMELTVKSVSPMNEPNTNFWPAYSYKQEGCHVEAGESQSKLLVLTREAFDRHGLQDVVLTTSDETNPGKQIEEVVALSPKARQAISRISVHSYATNGICEMGQLAKDEKINLWMSEVDGIGTAGEDAGEMAPGLWISEKIISDLEDLEPSAWVLWQVIDTHVSKDGYKGRVDKGPLNINKGYWGLAWADHDTEEIVLTQKYYAMGQFSRYIRPGSTIILCPTDREGGVHVIASVDKNHKSVTAVCVNLTAQEQPLALTFDGIRIKGTVEQIRTSGDKATGEHWNQSRSARVKGESFDTVLAPNSVTTFLISCRKF